MRDGFTLCGARPSYAPDLELEPIHIEVRLALNLPAARAVGEVVTTVRSRGSNRSLVLDAVGLEDVDVTDTEGRELQWRYDGERVHATWSDDFDAGEERRLRVRYAVVDPITGMRFSRPDDAYPERPLFVCTDHETERARYWLPCVDYPSVRTRFDFHLTVDAALEVVCGGLLVAETEHADGTKTAHWKLDQPCPSYLACLAAGQLVRHDDGHVDGRELTYWGVAPTSPADLERTFGRTAEMMRWMERRLDRPFPYPKYHQLAVPEIGGAMENITLVTWDQIYVNDEALQKEHGWRVDSINLHEMAHSYFGDSVVIRHFEHAWLKESWAVYMETCWFEDTAGRALADYSLWLNAEAYFKEVATRYARPLVTRTYDSSWRMFDMHTYPGGAWRIHMLRRALGDAAFWAAVSDYLGTYADRVVETDDFRRKLEEHSGRNLTRFFDEWVAAPGHPQLKASWSHDAEQERGTLAIEQTQRDEAAGIGLFAFTLPILWVDAAGEHRATLEVEATRHELVVETSGRVERVEIDPDQDALFALQFDPGEDLCERALKDSPSIRSRIQAARALIATGRRSALAKLENALQEEPFWGVRAEVAKALGESRATPAIGSLARLLLAEQDDRAQFAFATAAGEMRSPELRAALLDYLQRPGPPRARGAAWASLGAQRNADDVERLRAAREEPSRHALVRAGAWRGFARLRVAGLLAELEAELPYGREGEESRVALIEAYGAAARLATREQREHAARVLADLLRDPKPRVRIQAATGLAGLGVPIDTGALAALKALHPAQDGPGIERLVRRARRGESDTITALRKELDELDDRCQRLASRVDSLEARGEA